MALNSTIWGDAVTDALLSGVTTLTGAEETTIRTAWRTLAGVHVGHITGNAVINTLVTGVTGTGGPIGPYPITAQPGIGTVT